MLFPLAPHEGESLYGFIARTTAWNFLEMPKVLLDGAGIADHRHILGKAELRRAELARVLAIPEHTLAAMTPHRIGGDRHQYVDLHGVKLRYIRFEEFRRWFSPSSLRRSPHHRMSWTISALPFCTESWEFLQDRCPSCGKQLGWHRSLGIEVCERCEADLRTATAELVPPEERPPLSIVAGLVDQCPMQRASARRELPKQFWTLPEGSILELTIALGRIVAARAESGDEPCSRPRHAARQLSVGVRTLLDYPRSFEVQSGTVREDNTQQSEFFRRLRACNFDFDRQLGAFVADLIAEHEPVTHGPSRMQQLRKARGQASIRDAAIELGVDNVGVRKLIESGALPTSRYRGTHRRIAWIRPEDIAAVKLRLLERISATSFQKLAGLPLTGVEQLVSLGLLEMNAEPAVAALYPGLQLTRHAANEFLEKVRGVVSPPDAERRLVTLEDAFRGVGGQDKPWGPVIYAALEGRLPEPLMLAPAEPLKLECLLIPSEFAQQLALGMHPELHRLPKRAACLGDAPDMSRTEAERYLNCYPRDVSWLIAAGHLSGEQPGSRRIPRRQVLKLGGKVISSREIAWRWRVSPSLRDSLETEHGIQRRLGPFWPRDQVTEFFAQRLPMGVPQ